jgi:hypothetical protein
MRNLFIVATISIASLLTSLKAQSVTIQDLFGEMRYSAAQAIAPKNYVPAPTQYRQPTYYPQQEQSGQVVYQQPTYYYQQEQPRQVVYQQPTYYYQQEQPGQVVYVPQYYNHRPGFWTGAAVGYGVARITDPLLQQPGRKVSWNSSGNTRRTYRSFGRIRSGRR